MTGTWRLVAFDALRSVGNWRWLAVPPVFFAGGWLSAGTASYDFITQRPLEANLWDAPLAMVAMNPQFMVFFFIGFVLVSGDIYVRERASGAAGMALIRTRSREVWWASKVVSLAVPALLYPTLALLSALAAGAVRLPLSWAPSEVARIPWGSQSALYPRFEWMPMPLFLVVVALYSALILWAMGAVVLALSTLYPRMLTPLVVGLVWGLSGTAAVSQVQYREELPGTADPLYHLDYLIHFSKPGFQDVPWAVSLAVAAVTLALALAVGAWSVSRADM